MWLDALRDLNDNAPALEERHASSPVRYSVALQQLPLPPKILEESKAWLASKVPVWLSCSQAVVCCPHVKRCVLVLGLCGPQSHVTSPTYAA